MCQHNVRTFVRINHALQVTAESEERVLSVVSALTKIEDDLRAVLQQMQNNRSNGRKLYKQIQILSRSENKVVTNESSPMPGNDAGETSKLTTTEKDESISPKEASSTASNTRKGLSLIHI